ncbi:MAG TPA: hypothetical protein PLH19_09235 [Anaerolineae bacterium]|nr:hypothetical protein [Anaerolineae bacterium]HQH38700.1 hypothetical protein [Anaerolineae bacterium]
MDPLLPHGDAVKLRAPCRHQWVELGMDAVYCWRRQCRLCGAIEEQEHMLVYAYTVVGCCAHPYVCERCGYIPQ